MLLLQRPLQIGLVSFSFALLMCAPPVEQTPDPPAPSASHPLIRTMSPMHVDAVGGEQVVMVGEGLHPQATVTIAGVAAAFVPVSETQLLVTVPKAPIGMYGFVEVKVQNPDGAVTTNAHVLSYYNPSYNFSEQIMMAPDGTRLLTMGDFNKDGKLDMAVVASIPAPPEMPSIGHSAAYEIAIFLGNGDGTFTAGSVVPLGSWQPTLLLQADVDGDGRADLLVDNTSDSILILYAHLNGTFANDSSSGLIPVSYGIEAVRTGDLDKDGIMDIVIGTNDGEGAKNILVYLGKDNRPWADREPIVYTTKTEGGKIELQVGDVNNDGILDIAYTLQYRGIFVMGLGKGDGTFVWKDELPIGLTLGQSLVLADMNGDGKLDVLTRSLETFNLNKLVLLEGKGDGTFVMKPSLELNLNLSNFVVADINKDHALDIITAHFWGNSFLPVVLGRGDGSLQDVSSFLTSQEESTIMAVGDLNGDGLPDMVVVGASQNSFSILLNQSH